MPLPKYIVHPSLLLAASFVTLWLVWSKVPTSTEVRESFSPARPKSAPAPLLERSELSEISDFTTQAEIIFANAPQKWIVASKDFDGMNDIQYKALQRYLKGKLLKKPTRGSSITLPIELYDPLCFTPKGKDLACPFVIKN